MEGESFSKPFHFPLPVFFFKHVVVGNQCPRSTLLGLQSIFGFQARRLESVELSQPTNAFKDFGDFVIFISIDHQDNVSLI